MYDWSIRNLAHSAIYKIGSPLTKFVARNKLEKIAESLTQDPYPYEFREDGIDLAEDVEGKKKNEIAKYLCKIFGLDLSDDSKRNSTLVNPDVEDHLDEMMKTELAHTFMIDPIAQDHALKKQTSLFCKALQVQALEMQKKLGRITIPLEVFEQLNIDSYQLKDFHEANSINSYAFPEMMTLMKKDLNRFDLKDEISHLALPILWNLPEIYAEFNKGKNPNYNLLDRLNFVVRNTHLDNSTGILDQAGIIYYCVVKAKQDIESSDLQPETKTALEEICDGVILNLVKRLKDSRYTGLNCIQLDGAFKELKTKVMNLEDKHKSKFKDMSFDELEKRAYVQRFKTYNPDTLKIKDKKRFNWKIAPIKDAVDSQWRRRPNLINSSKATIIKEMQAVDKIFLPLTSSRYTLTCLNQALELLQEINSPHLIMDRTTCQETFNTLNRYANRLAGKNPNANSYTVLKDFLASDQPINDLQAYLFGTSVTEINKVNMDRFFQSMRNTANNLKVLKLSLVENKEIDTQIQKYASGKIACFVSKLPTQQDTNSLNLAIEYIDPDTDFNSSEIDRDMTLERLIALAAYKVVNGPVPRTKSPIAINDLNDPKLLQSIDKSNLIKVPRETKNANRELLLTICNNSGDENRISTPTPTNKKPVSPKTPSPAPVLSA